ncbi:hypothetical protein [Nitrosomonas sp.]|uniref:hypothetical protein n=1 Tax=Nitrosomonas sp. TaxID=42353 RepID=UPI001DD0FA2F|nr:hypothetical protein [Nitrosomonas sp.]MBX3615916.1 hypothetical protein [Nitrosomonas sp.]
MAENRKIRSQPKTAMGTRRAVEISACLWMDLLGYGEMLRKSNFDLTLPESLIAIERLFLFQDVISSHSSRLFTTVVLNDGCVMQRRLTPRSKSVTYDFLRRAYCLHQVVNSVEAKNNFPGVRSVVAVGFRYRRTSDNKTQLVQNVGKKYCDKVKSGELSLEEAVFKALTFTPSFDLVPELQANFAFSKAYIADSKGSKGGFGGANFFLDVNMLPKNLPKWIRYDEVVELKEEGIGGKFLKVSEMDLLPGETENHDLPDAFDIATAITGSTDTAILLKKMKLVGGNHRVA